METNPTPPTGMGFVGCYTAVTTTGGTTIAAGTANIKNH